MALVYLLARLMTSTQVPSLEAIATRTLLFDIYKLSEDEPHVQTFILDHCQQIHVSGFKYSEFSSLHREEDYFPLVLSNPNYFQNYKNYLTQKHSKDLEKVPGWKELSRNEKHLIKEEFNHCKRFRENKRVAKLELEPIKPSLDHHQLETAWYRWFEGDKILHSIYLNLQIILSRVKDKTITQVQAKEKIEGILSMLAKFAKLVEYTNCFSEWGKNLYMQLKEIDDQLEKKTDKRHVQVTAMVLANDAKLTSTGKITDSSAIAAQVNMPENATKQMIDSFKQTWSHMEKDIESITAYVAAPGSLVEGEMRNNEAIGMQFNIGGSKGLINKQREREKLHHRKEKSAKSGTAVTAATSTAAATSPHPAPSTEKRHETKKTMKK